MFGLLLASTESGQVSSPRTRRPMSSSAWRPLSICVQDGEASAWVTGPINKAAFNEAGITFSGHTEWIAERAGISRVVMMLAAGSFRVALVTTHLPLNAVPAAITDDSFETTLRITDQSLRSLFGSESPRLGICGLNPHAGESGYLGREEIEVLEPVIEKLRGEGMNLSIRYRPTHS